MTIQHKSLANGAWNELSFIEQMANIGSEVIRALKWQQKENTTYATLAFHRALELLSLTIDDTKNTSRLTEIMRIYEVLVDYFAGENLYHSSNELLTKQFLSYNYAASILRKSIVP